MGEGGGGGGSARRATGRSPANGHVRPNATMGTNENPAQSFRPGAARCGRHGSRSRSGCARRTGQTAAGGAKSRAKNRARAGHAAAACRVRSSSRSRSSAAAAAFEAQLARTARAGRPNRRVAQQRHRQQLLGRCRARPRGREVGVFGGRLPAAASVGRAGEGRIARRLLAVGLRGGDLPAHLCRDYRVEVLQHLLLHRDVLGQPLAERVLQREHRLPALHASS
mmetsp:Transcript_20691/g.61068  ORF Transcript_20691/g.61068 Transcript_20691/m.61068 type:complete len:224 (-) Transcript_20691:196-867(-)